MNAWVGSRSFTLRAASSRRSRLRDSDQTHALLKWLRTGTVMLARSVAGFGLSLAALALAGSGVFRDPERTGTPQLAVMAGLGVLLLARLFERLQRGDARGERTAFWGELELGSLFVAAAFVLIELTGGPSGLLYPLLFALVAFLVAFHGLGQSIYFLGIILGTEACIWLLQPAPDGWRLFASHASFNLLFGLLYALFLRTEVAAQRNQLRDEISSRLGAIASEARDFRLTSGLSLESRELPPEEIQRRRAIGSVQAIHESLYNVLAVAERALSPYTVALLWLDADDRWLRVKELRSQSDHVTEKPMNAGEGLVGAITKRHEPLVLTNLKPGHSGLVYYSRTEQVTDFAGVPVLEGKHLRGVLIADRKNGRPFDEGDLAVMGTLAEEIVRAVQVERIFSEMDREKYQKERFYQASRDFNKARTVDQVAEVAIQASRRVADVELAAVAVATADSGQLLLTALQWEGHPQAKELVGRVFASEVGLVGAAIKARHALPHGTARAPSQCIFAPDLDVQIEAVKVLPLLWKGTGVGALVLGSRNPDFLTVDLLDMLRVVADHAAIAVANAQMYEHIERLATTDGLTGLCNHRNFQQRFDQVMAGAERYGRLVSLILTDIDHFKSVNDTYGHPVGDLVLKRVSAAMASSARRTDLVARYGGEEFAVLMEETGTSGAIQMAERIRTSVENELFRCENGTFRCTISLGIASFPAHANSKPKLTECADQALYQAKRSGRNRAVVYGTVSAKAAGG